MGMIDSSTLHGFSIDDAQSYGMPHIGAHYYRDDVSCYLRDSDECTICGKQATNTHHHPARGKARSFTLKTKHGAFVLKPALFALCGSGTTGCHGLVHQRKIEIKWKWDSDEYQEQWFSGYLLAHGVVPHSERLYEYGRWSIGDGTTEIEIRGSDD